MSVRTGGVGCELGEGPFWSALGRLHWVDIPAGTLYSAPLEGDRVGEATVVIRVPETLAAAAEAEGGGYLLACRDDVVRLGADGALGARLRVVPEGVGSRLNDGAVDPAGRYVVGTLALDGRTGQERLVRIESDGRLTVLDDDLTLSNGLGWSPDGGTLYSIDSLPGTLWHRSYDPQSGQVGARSALVRFGDDIPDGLAVDAAGNLWVAVWATGQVWAFDPTGQQIDVVQLEVPSTTSVAFVGDDLATMVITTARIPVGDAPLLPEAGLLHVLRHGVTGLPSRRWVPSF